MEISTDFIIYQTIVYGILTGVCVIWASNIAGRSKAVLTEDMGILFMFYAVLVAILASMVPFIDGWFVKNPAPEWGFKIRFAFAAGLIVIGIGISLLSSIICALNARIQEAPADSRRRR